MQMSRPQILFFAFLTLASLTLQAQSLEEARTLLKEGNYVQAKPVFEKLASAQPGNGNHRLNLGICLLHTGEAEAAIEHLEVAVKKRVPGGQLHLGQAYMAVYRLEEAVTTLEAYRNELTKRKRATDEVDLIVGEAKNRLRMLKSVEQVCFIDSVVVDKARLLSVYALPTEVGKVEYLAQMWSQAGAGDDQTMYQTELGNRAVLSLPGTDGHRKLAMTYRQGEQWGTPELLPAPINEEGSDTAYPFLMPDGTTLYYATNGKGLGGYDLYVTRHNTRENTFFVPANLGMPFNSPGNDYLYVVDEFNELGWFATDRNQAPGKVCVYVFIPNKSKKTYDYETTDLPKLARLARIHAIQETWIDEAAVAQARRRLEDLRNRPSIEEGINPGEAFIINHQTIYHHAGQFRSAEARRQYIAYLKMLDNLQMQERKLESMRQTYVNSTQQASMAPGLLDLEQRVEQMHAELSTLVKQIRQLENATF